MDQSNLTSLFGLWNQLQQKLASTASSSSPFVIPELTKLNDMVYEVYCPEPQEKVELEIVFFHGLQIRHSNEAYYTTWMSHDSSDLWLTWILDLFPNSRILLVSYDSSVNKTHKLGRLDMYCTGENLVSSLTADEIRVGKAKCPVVLVGHCLGGLVLKELCISAGAMISQKSAETLGLNRVKDLFSNLRGMFFYGTPHGGSSFCDSLHGCLSGELLKELKTHEASTARRNQNFDDLKSKHGWLTCGVGESYKTYVESLGEYVHLVPEASSRQNMDSYYSAPADHYDVCRPQGKKSTSFLQLAYFLGKMQRDEVSRTRAAVDAKCSREYFVDMEGRSQAVQEMLARPDTEMVVIVGMSGIGKTTLARRVFNEISHNFDATCFVSLDRIEASSNGNEQLLQKIQDAIEGVNGISNHKLWSVIASLKKEKVLLVLDNVESQGQLDALDTDSWLLGSASRLIVTTTDARLGSRRNTFPVPYFSSEESDQLFRHYAFEDGNGPNEVEDLISRVIRECGNFPLSLKLMGAYVSKWDDVQDKHLWLDLVDRLGKAQEVDGGYDYRLWAKLRLCYDALEPTEKEIYLDVATFFHGFQFSVVKCIWNGSRESPHIAWMNLRQRFLANVDDSGNIWMHKHLRSLGQRIACPRSRPLDKWERIWDCSTAKELISSHQGIVDTQAMKLQVRKFESLTLRNTTFLKCVQLQYLILDGVKTSVGRVELPQSLVYLRWKDGLFTSCPVDFTRLEKLVVLELVECKAMRDLPRGVVTASKLTWLELEGCLSLTELPLGLSNSLEYLGLNRTGLRELPGDLVKCTGLQQLNASQTQLVQVPRALGRLEMLSSLDLGGTPLTILPNSICDLKGLSKLYLSNTMLSSLPENIGQLQNLTSLTLRKTYITRLPESVGDLSKLTSLDAAWTQLDTLPDSICKLRSLSWLLLPDTQISTLPDQVGQLVNLRLLKVSSPRWRRWPETIGMLSGLEILYVGVRSFRNHHELSLDLKDVEGENEQDALPPRDDLLQIGMAPLLSLLPRLNKVRVLTLQGRECAESCLQSLIFTLCQMPCMSTLRLEDFNLVASIPSELGKLTQIRGLHIVRWERLLELPESLVELRLDSLELMDIPKLRRLPQLPHISLLEIRKCGSLQNRQCPLSHRSSHSNSSERTCTNIELDSWRILECIVECNKTQLCPRVSVVFLAECKQMKEALRKAVRMETPMGTDYELDSKVAMEVFNTDIRLPPTRLENDIDEASRTASSHSSSRNISNRFYCCCSGFPQCDTHSVDFHEPKTRYGCCVYVVDSEDEGGDTFVDEKNEQHRENEAPMLRILRALWSFLFSRNCFGCYP